MLKFQAVAKKTAKN